MASRSTARPRFTPTHPGYSSPKISCAYSGSWYSVVVDVLSSSLELLAFVAVLVLVTAVVLVKWSRWLGGKYGAPRWIRWVGPVTAALWSSGPVAGAVATVMAVHALDGRSVADQVRVFSLGAAEAVYNIVLGYAVVGALMLVLTWKYHWAAKKPAVPQSPPYR